MCVNERETEGTVKLQTVEVLKENDTLRTWDEKKKKNLG